MAGGMNLDNWQ